MAFTAPRTWTATELVTAAMMNTHVRDNLNALWVGTTAGDMDYYSSATAKARIGIGALGQVLTPQAGVPVWTPLSSITYPARMYLDPVQSIPTAAVTIVGFQTETFDPTSVMTVGAAAKYTAPRTGYYQVNASVQFGSMAPLHAAEHASLFIYVNGALSIKLDVYYAPEGENNNILTLNGSDILYLTATDFLDIRVYQNCGVAVNLLVTDTWVSVARVG
jgi:hypothetical protein